MTEQQKEKAVNIQLSEREAQTICNALFVAADRFKQHAKRMRELARTGGGAIGAKRLAEQFDRQEEEARGWAKEFSEAEAIIIQSRSEGVKG